MSCFPINLTQQELLTILNNDGTLKHINGLISGSRTILINGIVNNNIHEDVRTLTNLKLIKAKSKIEEDTLVTTYSLTINGQKRVKQCRKKKIVNLLKRI